MTDEASGIARRLQQVRQQIDAAAQAAGRDAAGLTLIAVTKFQPAAVVRELVALGVRDFGESRHQEAREKAADLADLDLTWHFIGQLQSKKARQVAAYSRVIHSLDRASVADYLAGGDDGQGADERRWTEVFLQVNLTDDPGRGGVPPASAEALAEHVSGLPGLRLRGVMAVAPLGEPARAAFERLRHVSEAVRAVDSRASDISSGMSNDFADAIAEGATHLRIGSAITGNRPAQR